MTIAILQFPGSNCDQDCVRAVRLVCGVAPTIVWHQATTLPANTRAVLVPGGFSYGDYLRSGAMAAHSAVMPAVRRFADGGGVVLGICNGFQILTEAGLLPGVLLRNRDLAFLCQTVTLTVERNDTPWTTAYAAGATVHFPIAHHDGNYFVDASALTQLQQQRQIVFRYGPDNPNGSVDRIAGVCNVRGNVVGLMPHPERVVDALLGGTDGRGVFESLKRVLV